ncbi:ABC transporter permease [Thermodesulfobacteriota bacterium]
MITLRLAYRNLVGAGLRTWLNVFVLSFTYVLIIWHQGLFSGVQRMASREYVQDEIAGGQYWVGDYDPYDPLSLNSAHRKIPRELKLMIQNKQAVPVLIRQGTIYPEGRMQTILVKGIPPDQEVMNIPTEKLDDVAQIPVMVGKLMASKNSFKVGDSITMRWRDSSGTFDAADGEIVEIMGTNVPSLDSGQLWIPLDKMQQMFGLEDEATLITVSQETLKPAGIEGWIFRNHDYLLKDFNDMIKSKRIGGAVLYAILLFLSMLAIFDTQVLAIFRRRKEIGTLMALGMVRSRVIGLFTFEGAMHGILGIVIAAFYGIPILIISAKTGIPLPESMNAEDFGFIFTSRLFPAYSPLLVGVTVLIVMTTVTIVSYLPSRKISGMKPTEALKGKMS